MWHLTLLSRSLQEDHVRPGKHALRRAIAYKTSIRIKRVSQDQFAAVRSTFRQGLSRAFDGAIPLTHRS